MWDSLPPVAQEFIYEKDVPLKVAHVNESFDLPDTEVRVAGIIQKDDSILFIKSCRDGRDWEFPGGRLKPNENPEEAIKREFTEETGITVEKVIPVLALVWAFKESTIVQLVFHIESEDKVGVPDETEVCDIDWFETLPDNISFGDVGEETYRVILEDAPESIAVKKRTLPFDITNKKSIAMGGAVAGSAIAAGLAQRFLSTHREKKDD